MLAVQLSHAQPLSQRPMAEEHTSSPHEERPSSQPGFWDERYAREDYLFGTSANRFIAAEAARIPHGSDVVELGAGEGRNLVYVAGRGGHRVTAVDFSQSALQKAQQFARRRHVPLRIIKADLRAWTPEAQWDAVLVTFVHLLPEERPEFYRLIQEMLRPGGLLLAEWFDARHAAYGYARVGPSRADRLISEEELRRHFPESGLRVCKETDVYLSEGPVLKGKAAVVRLVWQKERGG